MTRALASRALLGALLGALAGCPSRADRRYCDAQTPCADPAFPACDLVTHECEEIPGGNPDLRGADDLSVLSDGLLPQPDLSLPPPDLTLPDLAPMCTTSANCFDVAAPICDAIAHVCRACSGPLDDVACSAAGPARVCRLAGVNAGRCVACNNNAECAAATPVCGADGSCKKCSTGSECASGVCDLRPAAVTVGQCAPTSDIVYVDNNAVCATGAGTALLPYCQINQALTNLGGKHFIKVAGSATSYNAASSYSTGTLTAFITGPGRDATPPATVVQFKPPAAAFADSAVDVEPGNNGVIDLTFDGFVFSGTDQSVVYCDGTVGNNNSRASVTIRNSLMSGGLRGARGIGCALTVTESIIVGPSVVGASFETGTNWTFVNNSVSGAAGAGVNIDAAAGTGTFRFNTLAFNASGVAVGGVACGKAQTLESSIIVGNAHDALSGGSQFSGSCALVDVVTGTDSIVSAGKLAGNPVFRSALTPVDLRLDVSSPANVAANSACCIDKVPASLSTPALDLEREARPRGAACDVGADEAL